MYPLIELSTILACLGIYMSWGGLTGEALILMMVVPILMALLVIDLKHYLLPNQLILIGISLWCVLALFQGFFYEFEYGYKKQLSLRLVGAFVFLMIALGLRVFMKRILKKEALGLGDVKFFGMAGLYLGISFLPFFLILSGVLGVFIGLFFIFTYKKQVFPFGPALILSLYVALLLQGLEIVPFIGLQ